MENPVIDVRDLHVYFHVYGAPPVRAVHGIDLAIRSGEILGLVGESGSGKTTLARAIMMLVPPPGRIVKGKIFFNAEELTLKEEDEIRGMRGRDLAMIVPNPRGELNPLLSVGEQIANVARVHKRIKPSEARKLALDMLKAVSIPDPERRFRAFPHELSGGMAQRIVIAMALVCSPKFIISDDATSGLDVTVQAQILDLLRNLVKEKNTSMLYITRDIGVTAHFCDRVAIIYMGEILESAKTVEFFNNPVHPYSVMLLAAFSHNPKLRALWLKTGGRANPSQFHLSCTYASRCPRVKERCLNETPLLQELAFGHLVRCHFPVKR